MKLTLIMLVAIAAVAIGASVEDRRRRDSGADYNAAGAIAGGRGYHVAAKSGVVETKDVKIAQGAASAEYGTVRSDSMIGSMKVRDSGDDKNARSERSVGGG